MQEGNRMVQTWEGNPGRQPPTFAVGRGSPTHNYLLGAPSPTQRDASRWGTQANLWRTGLALGLAVLASGCQRMYWYQEGKTFDECRADYEGCQAELLKRTDRRYASSYRHRFIDDCMRARGYEVVAGKDLPLDVAREDPMVPSDWPGDHAYGVAGSVPPEPGVPSSTVARSESAALMRGAPRSAASARPPPRRGSASSSP